MMHCIGQWSRFMVVGDSGSLLLVWSNRGLETRINIGDLNLIR